MNELQYRYLKIKADNEILDNKFKNKLIGSYLSNSDRMYNEILNSIKHGYKEFKIYTDYTIDDKIIDGVILDIDLKGIKLVRSNRDYDINVDDRTKLFHYLVKVIY